MDDIRLESDEGVVRLVLSRGDGRNAVRPQSLREICQALDEAAADPAVRALILTADGEHFSAGADFGFLQGLATMAATDIKAQIYSAFQGAARRLYTFPKPTIAAINGAAVTVGCELALACDFRLISPTARFQESWIRLGLMPPLGGLFLLPRIVGLTRASDMVLSGRPVGAQEALAIGLATSLSQSAEALAADAMAKARELADLPPLAYATVKEALHRGLQSTIEGEWSANVSAQSLLIGTEDFREGLAAAMERRPGVFKGA